jgi:phosphatidylglycerol:prolipoprotein diacylglycerol transferase
MHPILFESPRITSYGLMMVMGIVVAWMMARRQAAIFRRPPWTIDLMAPLVVGAGMTGVWLGERAMGEGDRVLYLALLPAVAVGIGYSLFVRIPLGVMGDIVGVPIGMAIVIGRLGCFLAGCCFGSLCEHDNLRIGIRFPIGSLAHHHQMLNGWLGPDSPYARPVHATQLYEAVGVSIVSIAAAQWMPRRRAWGETFLILAMGYAAVRFVVEFFRGDFSPMVGPLRLSQALSVGVFAAALATWIARRRMAGCRVEPGAAASLTPGG